MAEGNWVDEKYCNAIVETFDRRIKENERRTDAKFMEIKDLIEKLANNLEKVTDNEKRTVWLMEQFDKRQVIIDGLINENKKSIAEIKAEPGNKWNSAVKWALGICGTVTASSLFYMVAKLFEKLAV